MTSPLGILKLKVIPAELVTVVSLSKYVHKLLVNVIEELLNHNTCQHMNMQLDRETRINYLYQLVTVR